MSPLRWKAARIFSSHSGNRTRFLDHIADLGACDYDRGSELNLPGLDDQAGGRSKSTWPFFFELLHHENSQNIAHD
jgi:hypothetical protein